MIIKNLYSTARIALALTLLPAAARSQEAEAEPEMPANPIAVMKTSEGEIRLELFRDSAPETVENFVELAEGRKEFTDPETGEKATRPFYDGLIFHRVIPEFMVQGGDPLGNGTGDPGYKFDDEIDAKALGLDEMKAMEDGQPHPWLLIRSQPEFQARLLLPLAAKMGVDSQEDFQARLAEVQAAMEELTLYDAYVNQGYEYQEGLDSQKPVRGVIAMANSGPNTNGSQFFINVTDTPHLTGKHTVFGKVISGMDVVDKISEVPTNDENKPDTDVVIESIRTLPAEG